jgi:hypothetical protein
MKRLSGGLALLAVMLAGCGSSAPAPHTTSQQSLEVQSRAELRQAEAAERAEGKNPAQTRARAEAQESREVDASVHREQVNAAHAEAVAKAKERQTDAEIRSRRESEENSPDSHNYPPAVHTGFLRGCEETSGHEDSACHCALKRVEAKIPLGRHRQNERELHEGHPLPIIYSIEYGYCVGSEAVG